VQVALQEHRIPVQVRVLLHRATGLARDVPSKVLEASQELHRPEAPQVRASGTAAKDTRMPQKEEAEDERVLPGLLSSESDADSPDPDHAGTRGGADDPRSDRCSGVKRKKETTRLACARVAGLLGGFWVHCRSVCSMRMYSLIIERLGGRRCRRHVTSTVASFALSLIVGGPSVHS